MSPPLSLRELQALFWEAVRHPIGIDAFLDEASEAQRAAFETELEQTAAFSRRQRMTVYAESYFWRLFDVLSDQYRVVTWLSGKTRFHNLVTDFVWEQPSASANVRRFGAGFAAYIAQHAIADEVTGLAALAGVERCIVDALDAPNVTTVGADALTHQPPEAWPTMRLVAPPWVRLLRTPRSYPRLDDARRRGEDPPAALASPGVHHVLIARAGNEVFHRSVAPAEARALRAMLDGASFEQICAAAAAPDPIDAGADAPSPAAVVGWLRGWLESELICAVRSDR